MTVIGAVLTAAIVLGSSGVPAHVLYVLGVVLVPLVEGAMGIRR